MAHFVTRPLARAKKRHPPTPKMASSWMLLAILMLTASVSQATQIRLEPDGGYTGIVVKISKDVPEEKCPQILSNLKTLLRDSSKVLYQALDDRAFFKSVTIVVPSTWRDGKCQTIIRPPKGGTPYRHADVLLGSTHPIYGESPHTQQSAGCGQRGDFISLPYEFVTSWNNTWKMYGNPAKKFVSEWAKLRYGIFDEHGYVGDSMYPSYFYSNGKMLPTGTSNLMLGGVWINMMNGQTGCDPSKDRECFFYPNERNIEEVTCSLGNWHFLPNVTRFCDRASAAKPMAPTKHNILCEGKSAMDVINANVDFDGIPTRQDLRSSIDPIFEVVRDPVQQFILVMETSSSMDNHSQWKWINKAAQKFIRYDLPVNSNLAIVTFSNSSKVEHNMVQVHSDQVRARLADTIPDKYHLSRSDKRCVLCALQKVIHDVVRDNTAGTHILLVTRGSADTLSITDENIVRGYVADYNIKLSAVVLPETTTYLPFYDSVSALMGGKAYVVKNDNNIMDFYARLNEAFADILQSDARYPTEIPQLVHKEEFIGETAVSSGNFLIDSTLGRDTKFGIYVEDEEEHLIKSIRFTDSKGKSYGPFVRMSSDYDLVNFKTINFPAGQSPPFSAPHQIGMTWQYTIEWHSGSGSSIRSTSNNRKSIVIVTSKPRSQMESSLITVRTWTTTQDEKAASSNGTSSSPTYFVNRTNKEDDFKPVVLYAQVLRGDSPVIRARVMATVTVEQANGSVVTLSPVRLHDNGYGDPDILAGDGVYSRYLGRYLSPGRYKFTVRVDDNDNSAFYVATTTSSPEYKAAKRRLMMKKKKEATSDKVAYADLLYGVESRRACCGSSVMPALDLVVNDDRAVRTGIFRRSVMGPVVHLTSAPKQSDDNMPPARIGDLKIRHLTDAAKDKLLAEWTAPGGDFNVGSVASYRFVFSADIADLLDPNGKPDVLLGFDRMERAGTAAKFDFNFPHYDRDFYVGAFGFDVAGNRGKISNLVHVRIDAPALYLNKASNDAEPIMAAANPTEPNWIIIGAVSGVIGVLLVMGIVAISYYCAVARKRSIKTGSTSSVMNGGSATDETDSSSFDSDIKNIMSNPLGPALAMPRQDGSVSHHQQQGHHPHQQQLHHMSPAHHPAHQVALQHHQGVSTSSSSNTPSDQPTETTSATVTPVYWSASQLLSKLDHHQQQQHPQQHQQFHGNPYVNSVQGELYSSNYVPHGPHSLQPMLSPASLLSGQIHHASPATTQQSQQPTSLHNVSFADSHSRYSTTAGPSWGYHGTHHRADIPEEFTITVGNLHEESESMAPRNSKPSTASNGKVPPPVMPKPRNITQV